MKAQDARIEDVALFMMRAMLPVACAQSAGDRQHGTSRERDELSSSGFLLRAIY